MKYSSQHSFAQVPSVQLQRSRFDRSFEHKTTFDENFLIPFYWDDVIPGDTFSVNATIFCRFTTLKKPIMDNLWLDTFFFFVPYRLLWEHFQNFMGERKDPDDSIDYTIPQIKLVPPSSLTLNKYDGQGVKTTKTVSSVGLYGAYQFMFKNTLFDYFGIPTDNFLLSDYQSVRFKNQDVENVMAPLDNAEFCAFPFRAYNKIWNEWFRDENQQDSVDEFTGDGPDLWSPVRIPDYYSEDYVKRIEIAPGFNRYKFYKKGWQYDQIDQSFYTFNASLLPRGKRHDYFTSCLPWPQKGDEVLLPLGDFAPVVSNGLIPKISGNAAGTNLNDRSIQTNGQVLSFAGSAPSPTAQFIHFGSETGLQVDLSTATSASINVLREAFQIQRLLERDARGGTRYIELLKSHFGVTSSDARLQRSEYLGGSSHPFSINTVTQTSQSNGSQPLGNLGANGINISNKNGFFKSFEEHGIVIGLMCVRSVPTYQQGLDRYWHRKTRYDMYWPVLAHLGEQAVLQEEIYWLNTDNIAPGLVTALGTKDGDTFGFQERNAEYRYKPSIISGRFRTGSSEVTTANTRTLSGGGEIFYGNPCGNISLDEYHLSQYFEEPPVLGDEFIREKVPVDRVVAVPSEPHFMADILVNNICIRPLPMYSIPGLIDHF